MKSILEVQNLSKKYHIRHLTGGYLSFREGVLNTFHKKKTNTEDFYALKDVSFTVNPGDSIGIIGRNGAGKSTLLKVLSRITSPSKGKIITRGRIASLLEVGTGFHPELTGRENIYFNGSLLGMKRREIQSKFNEIVDFSGVEKFLDTPLKHYSSGMQLRLAFSVAAFLEPEILVIDEVLAVGDAEFQKKCMGKMEDVSKSGRTILFVSHNMAAVETLCQKSVLLQEGSVKAIGSSQDITKLYLQKSIEGENNSSNQFFGKERNDLPHITQLEFLCGGVHADTFYMGSEIEVRMHFKSSEPIEHLMMGIIVYDSLGGPLLFFNNKNYGNRLVNAPVTEGVISLIISELNIMPGFYSFDVYLAKQFANLDIKKNCFRFQVQYKHFTEAGEPLDEKYNRIFYKDVKWSLITY
jgi:lipopolysaccharide transport system ATP-binding protein